MIRNRLGLSAVLALGAALLLAPAFAPAPLAARGLPDITVEPRPMPDFPHQSADAWIHTDPIRRADLKGKVVMVEIWASV